MYRSIYWGGIQRLTLLWFHIKHVHLVERFTYRIIQIETTLQPPPVAISINYKWNYMTKLLNSSRKIRAAIPLCIVLLTKYFDNPPSPSHHLHPQMDSLST